MPYKKIKCLNCGRRYTLYYAENPVSKFATLRAFKCGGCGSSQKAEIKIKTPEKKYEQGKL